MGYNLAGSISRKDRIPKFEAEKRVNWECGLELSCSCCGPVAGSYNTAGTNELSGSAKAKEALESLSKYQFQLKDSMDLDMILRVELSLLVQCLWELVSRCYGR